MNNLNIEKTIASFSIFEASCGLRVFRILKFRILMAQRPGCAQRCACFCATRAQMACVVASRLHFLQVASSESAATLAHTLLDRESIPLADDDHPNSWE